METIFKFDNALDYKWGSIMWHSLFLPQLIVLLVDNDVGGGRDYLAMGALLSVFSYLIYTYYFFQGNPASTPSMVAITTESLGRWVLAGYYYPSNIVGSTPIGVVNYILLIISGIACIIKVVQMSLLTFNRKAYLDYEKGLLV